MVTVILTIRLELPGVGSLKEKRRIIKSLIARLRNDFNISVAEVGDNDIYRSATIGVAMVSNEGRYGHQVAAKIINKIDAAPDVVLADYRTETY
ncbi:MAG: DUF503 domain-containing protein [candidate division Zixibacteria bacterium]|nr:DUF503 domain-containing protein [candidate division Zixibacteria bacterium]